MADVVGVDPVMVARWIAQLGIPVTRPLSFERIGIGQSNLTYLVCDAADHRWVLRRPPMGQLLASAHDVAREARILTALQEADVPSPRVYGLTRDAEDVPLLLMEYVDGVVVDRMSVAESLTPQRRRQIALSMVETLVKIHAVDIDKVGLDDLASHKPYAQRQLKRWSGQWELSKTRELPALDDLTRRLVAAAPPQHELTLVHGDFHIRNVITSRAGGAVTAVLDWELSTLGDPLADMGSLLAYWPQAGEEHIAGEFVVTTLDGFPDRAEMARVYLERTGRDAASLAFWHALGLWKVAIIAEGIVRRVLNNPENRAASGTPLTGWIDALVHQARKVADDAGI
ncbi:phosphotransferase family protein [Mycolicibacter sp. MYC123]|uniref:Phosphotransferase family protein n=1 Tax=[Mycobacterium] zoologicum TaxID=2872311 RepID=A0ABU5YR73_9MYCO|nr:MULTISPECIES: phosphotransferase family protein [unclassified Mycolicibacter]MEB3051909.1 phosphotransferase family protein [Mycolicibacter sp. MYC123]MEB3064596.1 phosphotransferase family protein [Mycolicibacter sp. MYC101]